MTTPRRLLIHPEQPLCYHLVSRCVRRARLCGKLGRKDYSHRKNWLIDRIKQLTPSFALDVHAYAIMNNHFHLVVYFDPSAPANWQAEEVADRWLAVCPPKDSNGNIDLGLLELQKTALLEDAERLQTVRRNLGSLSVFMKMLKQPIARRANLEDDCQGHFFEKRFYSGALLDEQALLAAMAYVDLNPMRAMIAETLEASELTSIAQRIRDGDFDLSLQPVCSGLKKSAPILYLTLENYIFRLNAVTARADSAASFEDRIERWRQNVRLIRRPQRAYGTKRQLQAWTTQRQLQLRERPLVPF